jgi:hypothetical protein
MTANPAITLGHLSASMLVLVALGSACGRRDLPPTSCLPDAAADREDGAPSIDAGDSSYPDAVADTQDGSSDLGQCPDGFSACGNGDGLRCHDLGRSADHCGACGHACAPGLTCQAGACQQYRCKGAPTFKALAFNSIVEPLVRDVRPVLGDFDGDGILDFVGVPEANAPVSLLYGAGNGTFSTRQVIDPKSSSSRYPAFESQLLARAARRS